MQEQGRRGFFTALASVFKEESSHMIRPPYASGEETFDICQTCDAMCVSMCEEKIIKRDAQGIVFLDFSRSGCSDCHKCLEACTPNVLNDPTKFIQGKAKISTMSCMSHHDTICFSCKEPCMDNAIVFEGMFRPIIIPNKCTGCGYCVSVCPSGAITLSA